MNVSSAGDALSVKLKEMVRTGVFELDEDPGIAGSALIRGLLKGHGCTFAVCLYALSCVLALCATLIVCVPCLPFVSAPFVSRVRDEVRDRHR